MYYDIEGQLKRRELVYSKFVQFSLDYFNSEGEWLKNSRQPDLRERLWFVLGFFETGIPEAVKAGNQIIRATTFRRCAFAPMAAFQILINYDDKLEAESRAALMNYVSDAEHLLGADLEFRGANDNFATMATYSLLMFGQYFNNPLYTETGIGRLHQLREMLTRRGFATECNSPAYSGIQMHCMAAIAESVQNPEAKQLALQLEERLWVDQLSHYHPTTFQVAGPYSRAYEVDSNGHTHLSKIVLYALLGDQLAIHPMNTYFASKEGKPEHVLHMDITYSQTHTVWLMNSVYHCPLSLVEHACNKTYPYRVQGTFETSSSTAHDQPEDPDITDDTFEFPARSGSLSTYMTEDYALGVMTDEFRTGIFTDSFHILYRRRQVQTQEDISTAFCHYIINDKKYGGTINYSGLGSQRTNWKDGLLDEGRKIGLHHDRTAMMLYKPKLGMETKVTSLKLSIHLPGRYGDVEQIWLGDRRLENLEGASVEPCPVFVKDGPVYMAYFPLLFTNHGREHAVKVDKWNNCISVSFYNYEGPERDFAKRGYLLTGNGFIAEVRSEAEVGSFENFRSMFTNVKITDEWSYGTNITRMRRTKYERDELTMECVWSQLSEGVKFAAINGRIPAAPRLKITGLDVSKLPFLDDEN
jgi:hypothetical protein